MATGILGFFICVLFFLAVYFKSQLMWHVPIRQLQGQQHNVSVHALSSGHLEIIILLKYLNAHKRVILEQGRKVKQIISLN